MYKLDAVFERQHNNLENMLHKQRGLGICLPNSRNSCENNPGITLLETLPPNLIVYTDAVLFHSCWNK